MELVSIGWYLHSVLLQLQLLINPFCPSAALRVVHSSGSQINPKEPVGFLHELHYKLGGSVWHHLLRWPVMLPYMSGDTSNNQSLWWNPLALTPLSYLHPTSPMTFPSNLDLTYGPMDLSLDFMLKYLCNHHSSFLLLLYFSIVPLRCT